MVSIRNVIGVSEIKGVGKIEFQGVNTLDYMDNNPAGGLRDAVSIHIGFQGKGSWRICIMCD